MRAADAWKVAGDWLTTKWLPEAKRNEEAHGLVGAYIMGSLAALDADAEFNVLASDIDVALLVDPEVLPADRERYPHGKFSLFDQCRMQEIFVPATVLDAEEQLLTMLGLGCNLRNGRVLSDPYGRVERARGVVMEHWAAAEWTARRLERAEGFARRAMDDMAAASDPINRLGSFCEVMMHIAGLPAIATRETPTHRRCLVKARAIMGHHGRDDLYDRLVDLLGAQHADAPAVEAVVDDALTALEIQQRHSGEARDVAPELWAVLPDAVRASVFDVVQEGYAREAMLPALGNVAFSATLPPGAGSGDEVASLQELALRNLERVGIFEDAWEERVRSARTLTDDIARWCSELATGG